MFFARLFTIVKSNLNRNEDGGQTAYRVDKEAKFTSNTIDQATDMPMNAVELKEAQYLANLELKPRASFEEIKAAYKRLMKQYHPDKFQGNHLQLHAAELVTAKLNEAYSYFEKKYKNNI